MQLFVNSEQLVLGDGSLLSTVLGFFVFCLLFCLFLDRFYLRLVDSVYEDVFRRKSQVAVGREIIKIAKLQTIDFQTKSSVG